ncbi:Hypothetical protein CINCED_3A013822 [Cinara cedri]|uniref:Uncharacterized protein n=1 Tax=Cinara cedri TaxID=506608 RepID=A0A5E4MRT6_9HEMI|nr:Hypothetical protein CINCED_3A013822 [Cinara cedri]
MAVTLALAALLLMKNRRRTITSTDTTTAGSAGTAAGRDLVESPCIRTSLRNVGTLDDENATAATAGSTTTLMTAKFSK